VRDLDDADDLFQQTSLVLWDKFEQFDRSKNFINWACGVARYEVLNFVRSRSRHRLYFSDELNLVLIEAQESLEHDHLDERRDALAGCMKKLRERDLELLETCYGRSVCIQEVARTWGRSTHSIHNSLRRIRRVLFECVRRTMAQGELA
jgi:RNA polymerase sigma-70 factor (ECF subfamily)